MVVRIALALASMMSVTVQAAEPVTLYAAGSLRGALTEVAAAFEAGAGQKVVAKYGPSGTLKDEIAGGARADVFASANMDHPKALAAARKSGPVALFARNRLCALVRPGLRVEPATVLDRMLDPDVKLGTSTPRADPSGDYAWEMFRKADALKPGAAAALEKKALQLAGGPTSPAAPPGRALYGMLVAEGKADIFLTYCTNAREARRRIQTSRSWHCRMSLQWAPTTGSLSSSAPHPRPTSLPCSSCRWTASACSPSTALRACPAAMRSDTMKISARNKLKGKIVEIKKGATTAHVRIDVGGQTVTAAITNEATDELKLAPGQTVYAVIKASDVMVGID